MDEVGLYHDNATIICRVCFDGYHPDWKHCYPTSVGQYSPNRWGLYDMHGNVNEWCLDWYDSNYDMCGATNPIGVVSGSQRVFRGGEVYDTAFKCRSASRGKALSSHSSSQIGTCVTLHYAYINLHGFRIAQMSTNMDNESVFALDLRTGTRITDGSETIQWSGLWDGDANSTVKVMIVGGETIVTNESGAGSFEWNERQPGTYKFRHTTYDENGKAVKMLNATFELPVKDFTSEELRVSGYDGAFDGDGHSIVVEALEEAAVSYSLSQDGPFVAENPVFTNIVSTSVWYRVELIGYNTVTGSASVVISKANIGVAMTAVQRYPWNGLTDIDLTVESIEDATVSFEATDKVTGDSLDVKTLTVGGVAFVQGETIVTSGVTRLIWNATADLAADFVSTNVELRVIVQSANMNEVITSESVALDLRMGVRHGNGMEMLRYSSRWYGDASATVSMTVDGAAYDGLTKVSGEGVVCWDETDFGEHVLKLITYKGNTVLDTQTAVFHVDGVTSQGIPFAWLEEQEFVYGSVGRETYEEAALEDIDEDGYAAWEEYIIGTDPWDVDDCGFNVSIEMRDGNLLISWYPDLNVGGTKNERKYTVWEAPSVEGPWTEANGAIGREGLISEKNGTSRFYKVTVDLAQ